MSALRFLGKVIADIAVYLSCLSRQGFFYVLMLTDVATNMFWEYPLKTRSGDEVFTFIECALKTYPGDHILRHYHADGSAELIDRRIDEFLTDECGSTVTWSSTDMPELNAVLFSYLPRFAGPALQLRYFTSW